MNQAGQEVRAAKYRNLKAKPQAAADQQSDSSFISKEHLNQKKTKKRIASEQANIRVLI